MANKPREVKDEPTDRTRAAAKAAPADQGAAAADAGAAAADQAGEDGGEGDGEGDGDGGDQPAPAPAPAPAAAPAAPKIAYVAEARGNTSKVALDLLLDACELFGVNPERDQRPVELLSWRYREESQVEQVPASVTLVTAGGLKVVHYADPAYPMDPDTTERLRNVFNAWKKDKDGTKVPLPLPTDLTLPETAVTGLVQAEGHVYRQGYLRSGGKTEAARRGRR